MKLYELLFENISGEWWIDQYGNSMFADGDVGDLNHESYVLETLLGSLLDWFDVDHEELKSLNIGDYEEEIMQAVEKSGENVGSDFSILNYMVSNGYENAKEVYKTLTIKLDPRDYAMKYWDWKRVTGSYIQTWNFTQKDLRIISSGLSEAYGEEIEMESSDPTFTIEVFSNHIVFEDVPFSVIESENITGFRPYKRI
jgi:hypothetical protein